MSNKNLLDATPIVTDLSPADAKSVDDLLRVAKAPPRTKFLCVCDGSGSVRKRPGGWGACVVRLHDRKLIPVCGSSTFSTSQEAELRAVAEVLNWLVGAGEGNVPGGCHAVFIVDSKYSCQQVNKIADDPLAAMNFNKHAVILSGIQTAARCGVTFQAFHIHRNLNPLMVFADESSKISRKSVPIVKFSRLLHDSVLTNKSFRIDRQSKSSGGEL